MKYSFCLPSSSRLGLCFSMPFLESEDAKIHYAVWAEGTGPWITLVNGYTRTLVDFRAMGKYLSERGFRVLTFDNRGAGKTESPPIFSIEDIGEDLLRLWKHLGAERSHLLGISYGGTIALTLAARKPEQISKLVLVSVPLAETYVAKELRGPSRDMRKFQINMLQYFSKGFLAKNKILVEGFMRQNLKMFQDPESGMGARAQRESLQGLNLIESARKVKNETLILHGDEDYVVSPESAKELATLIRGSKLEMFPGIGHLLLAECPLDFYKKVEEFISL